MAYIAAVAAHPAFIARFSSELVQPGLRIPLTADGATFTSRCGSGADRHLASHVWRAVQLIPSVVGRHNLHVFPSEMRPESPQPARSLRLQKPCPIQSDYDEVKGRLLIGQGYVERVTPEMWSYEVSGKQVLRQWFSYRKANRERPIIGDRRPPSKLGEIQPDHWLAEYTTELINLLNVIGLLIELEPSQAGLLERVCSGRLIHADEIRTAGTLAVPSVPTRRTKATGPLIQHSLFD